MGPERVPRPKLISPITPVKLMSATKIKYGIRNDPPPYRETLVGNIQIFPIPTADPIHASTNPHWLLNDSLLFICLLLYLIFFIIPIWKIAVNQSFVLFLCIPENGPVQQKSVWPGSSFVLRTIPPRIPSSLLFPGGYGWFLSLNSRPFNLSLLFCSLTFWQTSFF